MDKPKHKTAPRSFFRYLLDEYILFRHDFVIETTVSVATVERRLRRLNNQKHGCLPRGKTAVTFNSNADTCHFVIEAQRGQKRGLAQSASAEGTIECNVDDMTVLRGKVWMSGYGYWVVIAIQLAQILYLNLTIGARGAGALAAVLLMSGLMLVIPAVFWVLMYLDRNTLLKHIYEAVRQAESEKYPEKAKVEKSKEPAYDSEQPSQSKAKR